MIDKIEYDTHEELEIDVEQGIAYCLALTYRRIPWQKIGVKSAHTFFVDRIRASSNARNFREFLDVFTRKVNVEFVKVEPDLIRFLEENVTLTMMLLRKESTFIANLALEKVEDLKIAEKLKASGQKTLI